MKSSIIPLQEFGCQSDIISTVAAVDTTEATEWFDNIMQKLMNVNHWDELCQEPTSVFRLYNFQGKEIVGFVKEGDFIRINIPGPGSKLGKGYDWVSVEIIQYEEFIDGETLSIQVRPTHHPLNPNGETAHFFQNIATSNFQVKRQKNIISAQVHGRNELANYNTAVFIDNLRNRLIGWGAKIGLSYPQWKKLTDGLLKK